MKHSDNFGGLTVESIHTTLCNEQLERTALKRAISDDVRTNVHSCVPKHICIEINQSNLVLTYLNINTPSQIEWIYLKLFIPKSILNLEKRSEDKPLVIIFATIISVGQYCTSTLPSCTTSLT